MAPLFLFFNPHCEVLFSFDALLTVLSQGYTKKLSIWFDSHLFRQTLIHTYKAHMEFGTVPNS